VIYLWEAEREGRLCQVLEAAGSRCGRSSSSGSARGAWWLAFVREQGSSSWVLGVLSECCAVGPGTPAPPDCPPGWLQGLRGGTVLAPRLCAHAAAGREQQWQHQYLGKGEGQAGGVLWG
jgi:hypothetical protein